MSRECSYAAKLRCEEARKRSVSFPRHRFRNRSGARAATLERILLEYAKAIFPSVVADGALPPAVGQSISHPFAQRDEASLFHRIVRYLCHRLPQGRGFIEHIGFADNVATPACQFTERAYPGFARINLYEQLGHVPSDDCLLLRLKVTAERVAFVYLLLTGCSRSAS